jgi:hypothetical protein
MSGIALLPSSVAGASDTTYTGDALWTASDWHVAFVGGSASDGAPVGALSAVLVYVSATSIASVGGRLAYAA